MLRKNYFSAIFFVTLLISICSVLVQPAAASEQNLESKSITILSDVVGLDMQTYQNAKFTQQDTQFFDQTRKDVTIELGSSSNGLRAKCIYIEDRLQLLYFSDGKLSLSQKEANTIQVAKGLLERYQTLEVDNSYNKFASMLSDVKENSNITRKVDNARLQIDAFENRTTYSWAYIDSNDVVANKKNVEIVFENGELKGFFNNWPFYEIISTTQNISAEQAEGIAIEGSKNYSYVVTDDKGVNTTISDLSVSSESLGQASLIYVNGKDVSSARGGNPNQLYLAWLIPLGLDKFYPGDISGLTVILWADTGEICSINRVAISSAPPEFTSTSAVTENQSFAPLSIMLTILVCVLTLTVGIKLKLPSLQRSFTPKFLAALLCLVTVVSLISLPIASADVITARSRVYAMVQGNGYNNEQADIAEAGQLTKYQVIYLEPL